MNGQIIPGTCIAVDFWKIRGIQNQLIHFLTHVHGDHIVGLTSSWTRPIYCSEFTAQILEAHYGVSKLLLNILQLNQCSLIQVPNSSDTFCVTAFDANHCPGALMLYFEGTFGNIFHTGDFRFSNEMNENLYHLTGRIDKLYLDNTFCSEDCNFPSREECQKEIIEIAKDHPESDILIGIRKLGKESMLAMLGLALNETIFVSPERFQISQCLFDSNIFSIATKDQMSRIQTLPIHCITRELVYQKNQVSPTIAILPTAIFTGLACKPFSRDPNVYVVPYSDHSSFTELAAFVKLLRPKQIIPIVNCTRGPFGKDISKRADMSLLQSFFRDDETPANDLQSKSNIFKDSCMKQLGNVNSNCTILKKDNLISVSVSIDSGSVNKYFSVRSDLSHSENRLTPSQLAPTPSVKRKSSFPDKRKKKLAKGVIFQEEDMEGPVQIHEKVLIDEDKQQSIHDNSSLIDNSSIDNCAVENLIALDELEKDSPECMVKDIETASNLISTLNCQEKCDIGNSSCNTLLNSVEENSNSSGGRSSESKDFNAELFRTTVIELDSDGKNALDCEINSIVPRNDNDSHVIFHSEYSHEKVSKCDKLSNQSSNFGDVIKPAKSPCSAPSLRSNSKCKNNDNEKVINIIDEDKPQNVHDNTLLIDKSSIDNLIALDELEEDSPECMMKDIETASNLVSTLKCRSNSKCKKNKNDKVIIIIDEDSEDKRQSVHDNTSLIDNSSIDNCVLENLIALDELKKDSPECLMKDIETASNLVSTLNCRSNAKCKKNENSEKRTIRQLLRNGGSQRMKSANNDEEFRKALMHLM